MAAGDLESRFSHLLKPIRDLTKNWDVDIAAQLEEYLEEIESISITFDNGKTSMNFAEAALLIQGSACVYSRKVEYLYSMVYEVLQTLTSKKKLAQAGSVGADGEDKDVQGNAGDQEDDFLTLDDIKEHGNIDVKNDDGENTNVVKTIPRTPMALVKTDDAEKGENPLLSRTGEVLGNRFDFKMNTSTTHAMGMMLLDMSHLSILENSLIHKPSSTPFHPPPQTRLGNEQNQHEVADGGAQIDEGLPADISMDDNVPGLDFDSDHMDVPMEHHEDEEPMAERRELRARTERLPAVTAKPPPDPWKIVDPHEVISTVNKPFKKAKTFRLPNKLETETSKKRKRKKGTETGKLQPITEFFAKAFFSASSRFPSNPLKAPSFLELEHLYWKEFKRRQAKIKKDKKLLADEGRLEELAEVEAYEEDAAQFALGGHEDDDDGFNPPDGASDLNFGDGENGLTDPYSNTLIAAAPVISSYEDLIRQQVDGYLASAQQYAHVTELTKRVAEWEEKIIPVLAEEDTHEPFDIHKYGTSVMDKCPEKTNEREKVKKITFRKVVEGKPAYEVCRLFLATLQLANNYNVEIGSKGQLEDAVDTMTVKLLSTKRHFEELKEYQAPSLST